MIVSYIPGRVRLRANALTNKENVEMLEALAKNLDGIISIDSNLKTGSALIIYDADKIDEAQLREAEELFKATFGEDEVTEKSKRNVNINLKFDLFGSRKSEIRALTTSFAMTLGSLAMGKRAHAIAGLAFTLLSAKHMYDRKKLL